MLLLNDIFNLLDPAAEIFFPSSHSRSLTQIMINNFNKEELESLDTNIRVGKSAKHLQNNQKYIISFAWAIHNNLCLLEALLNIIMVDTAERTSNKKRLSLCIVGKDFNGKMILFLICFMTNQQSWIFRWIVNVIMPRLISKKLLEKVHMIISDSNTQF